ncbi:MAG: sulfatase-like hydrolase/transferase [Rickettsiales bacterium]|jgi:glucan phosphoethanolaminetransferase (alkaline phosphatase superfamily)|nr:sulfatase-like hydrolase/transferase [Rickettsiales bacterium]
MTKVSAGFQSRYFWKKAGALLAAAMAVATLSVVPDYAVGLFNPEYRAHFHLNTFLYIFLLSACLTAVKSRPAFYALSGALWILVAGGFFYWLHFGRYFMAYDFNLLWRESGDVALAVLADIAHYWFVLPLVLVPAWAGVMARKYFEKKMFLSNWFLIAFACALLFQAWEIGRVRYENMPNPTRYMLSNSLKSAVLFIMDSARDGGAEPEFEPYKIEKAAYPGKATFILYMGESLNPDHMSVFGYGRPTTPKLARRAESGRLVMRRGISSSVVTGVSMQMFFNLQAEPQNYKMTLEKEANLFRLAKAQGFSTAFYSPQNSEVVSNIGLPFVDRVLYRDIDRKGFGGNGDEYAFRLLRETPRTGRDFLVVQMRAAHYPYEGAYANFPEYDVWRDESVSYKINTYDNAMLYVDDLLDRVLEWAGGIEGKVYVLITSDHGQMMGEDGLWGHSFLDRRVAEVPFILWTKGVPEEELHGIDKTPRPTHNEIGRFIARAFGVRVENPNTPADEFYISGPDLGGRAGFLKYRKMGAEIIPLGG